MVNYLDVTLDLNEGIFKPYIKPNNPIYYVHAESNHPPSILKNIPISVNDRLSAISSNRDVFDQAKPVYKKALQDSGYNLELEYKPREALQTRKRHRNVIWFTPPYSVNVKTSIGGKFLRLLDKCFPKENPLSKIFNRNLVKIWFYKLRNIEQKILWHMQES